jgi:hypothetical protein
MIKLTRWRKAVILTAIVIFIVSVSSGASYALWSINNSTGGVTSAGTLSLTANGQPVTTALTALTTSTDGAGSVAAQLVTIVNTGTVDMNYGAALSAVESPTGAVIGDNITYHVWVVTSASACSTTAAVVSPSWTGTLNTTTTNTPLASARPIAAGGNEMLCVRTNMGANPPQAIIGQSVAATLTFTGTSS